MFRLDKSKINRISSKIRFFPLFKNFDLLLESANQLQDSPPFFIEGQVFLQSDTYGAGRVDFGLPVKMVFVNLKKLLFINRFLLLNQQLPFLSRVGLFNTRQSVGFVMIIFRGGQVYQVSPKTRLKVPSL